MVGAGPGLLRQRDVAERGAPELGRSIQIRAVDDPRQETPSCAECDPSLCPVVDLTLPSVHRPNRGEVVPGGAEPFGNELVSERSEPVRVRRGDDDFADLIHRWTP